MRLERKNQEMLKTETLYFFLDIDGVLIEHTPNLKIRRFTYTLYSA